MNPVFVLFVLIGAVILWVLLSGLFRLIGGITNHFIDNTKKAIEDEPSNIEYFVGGFKNSFRKDKEK
jgi:hypothetical protein